MLYRFLKAFESTSLKCCENGIELFSFSFFIISNESYFQSEFFDYEHDSEDFTRSFKDVEKGVSFEAVGGEGPFKEATPERTSPSHLGSVFYLHKKDNEKAPLSSPLGTFSYNTDLDFDFDKPLKRSEVDLIRRYPVLFDIFNKLLNCGNGSLILTNKKTGEYVDLVTYCDNRVCLNQDCQEHRLYKFMKEHKAQIKILNKNMRVPKAWVFSDRRRKLPIDRGYIRKRMNELYDILDRDRHKDYGSMSHFSVHMEIKFERVDFNTDKKLKFDNSWYLHFHVVSAGIKNLKYVRKLWNCQIRYEKAINLMELGFYVSKYASKTPVFPTLESFCEYAQAVYKTQMHRFGLLKSANNGVIPVVEKLDVQSDWEFAISCKPSFVPASLEHVVFFIRSYYNNGG